MSQVLRGKPCATYSAKALKGRNVGNCGNVSIHSELVNWGFSMIKLFHIFGNEPCPCKSGKKYKDCCKNRKNKNCENVEHYLSMVNKYSKKSQLKLCLYEGCNAKPKDIILAHALQKNRILKKIAHKNRVLMQDFSGKPTMLDMGRGEKEPFYLLEEVNIKKATAFRCFCGKHDDELFQKIEKQQHSFEKMTEEQKFLFAYKTFSFEHYKDISVRRFHALMCKDFPENFKNPIFIYKYRNALLKADETEYYWRRFGECLRDRNFGELFTYTMKLPYPIGVSGYMSISPPFDINGKRIKGLIGIKKRLKRLFITIVPDETCSYILFSGFKDELTSYGQYFDSLSS